MLERKKGETLADLRKKYGCTWGAFCYRVYVLGWDYEKALTTPIHTKEFIKKRVETVLKLDKEGFTTRQIANELGITTCRVSQIKKKYLTKG